MFFILVETCVALKYFWIYHKTFDKDTQIRQQPFRVVAPIQPKQETTKRTAPTPINK